MLSALSRRLRGSIAVRIAMLFSLIFALGLIFAFSFTYIQLSYSLEASSKEVISARLREASALLSTGGIDGLKSSFNDEKNRILNASFMIRVIDEVGQTLYRKPSVQTKNFDFDSEFKAQVPPETVLGWHALSAINDEDKFDFLTAKVSPKLYIQVGKSSEDREAILDHILEIFEI